MTNKLDSNTFRERRGASDHTGIVFTEYANINVLGVIFFSFIKQKMNYWYILAKVEHTFNLLEIRVKPARLAQILTV